MNKNLYTARINIRSELYAPPQSWFYLYTHQPRYLNKKVEPHERVAVYWKISMKRAELYEIMQDNIVGDW